MRVRTYFNHVTMHAGSSQTLNKHQHYQHKIVQQTFLISLGQHYGNIEYNSHLLVSVTQKAPQIGSFHFTSLTHPQLMQIFTDIYTLKSKMMITSPYLSFPGTIPGEESSSHIHPQAAELS